MSKSDILHRKLILLQPRTRIEASKRSLKEKAFQTIIQNRISHGGILAPGAGTLKYGENGKGILSRWYPETLSRRILDIARIKERIKFMRRDGFDILRQKARYSSAIFFIDPPYTASQKKAGTRLYKYHQVDHEKLFLLANRIKGDFLMTYDNAEEVQALARKQGFQTRLVAIKQMLGVTNAWGQVLNY